MTTMQLLLAAGEVEKSSGLIAGLRTVLDQPHAGAILRALVILGCGALGIYLMLPRAGEGESRWPRYFGSLLATLALVFLVTIPIGGAVDPNSHTASTAVWPLYEQSSATNLTFSILALVSLASGIMMITARNPVYSALWFALVLLGNAGLFLLLRADFLAASTIIVYAGAIVVTFLFVIMLSQPNGAAPYDRRTREPLLSTLTGLLLASVLIGTLHYSARNELNGNLASIGQRPSADLVDADQSTQFGKIKPGEDHVAELGKTLFVDHVVSVEVIGVLLLAAVVGAVLIAGHPVQPAGAASTGKDETR